MYGRYCFFFFFSSRRRHTRFDCDWSSDVCSSDLESETSMSMIARPDLVHLDRAPQESGADQGRLKGLPDGLYTGIWWYARFPNHYAGEGAAATRELGEFEAKTWINGIVQAIRAIKADQQSLRLQNEFYE